MKEFHNRRFCWLLLVVGISIILIFVSSRYIAIGWGGWDNAGSALSLAFDKQKVNAVDRVVLCVGEESVEVTDQELICQLKNELMVAKRTDLKMYYPYYGKYILFYDGDDLVRQMRWGGLDKSAWVEVYNEDASHIVMFSITNVGLVCLAPETEDALNRLVDGLEY